MATDHITLNREDLYKSIWQSPASTLCKTYGISNVALAKICRKYNIPRPGLGYWQRLRKGIKQSIPKLPSNPTTQTSIIIRPQRPCPAVEPPPSVIAARDFFAKTVKPIKASEDLRNPHPLVRLTNAVFQEESTKSDIPYYLRERKHRLDIKVEKVNQRRALLFADSLLQTLEHLGHAVQMDETTGWQTAVKVGDDRVFIVIKDILDVAPKPSVDAKRPTGGTGSSNHTNRRKQRLRLEIDHAYGTQGCRQAWTDGKLKRLDEQIPSIVEGILFVASAFRVWRLEAEANRKRYEEERQKQEEALRRQQEELKARSELERQAALWDQCRNIRAFIEAIEQNLAQTISIKPGDPSAIWLAWARKHADRLDPFKSDYLTDIVAGKFDSRKSSRPTRAPETFLSGLWAKLESQ